MTTAQKRELERMTPTMRAILMAAAVPPVQLMDGARKHSGLTSATRILERRGFLTVNVPFGDEWLSIELTQSGREAVRIMHKA